MIILIMTNGRPRLLKLKATSGIRGFGLLLRSPAALLCCGEGQPPSWNPTRGPGTRRAGLSGENLFPRRAFVIGTIPKEKFEFCNGEIAARVGNLI